MAQYKRISYEFVEHTELAEMSWKEYNHGIDEPDEALIESRWIADKKRLYAALNQLTLRQRQVYIMRVGYNMAEGIIAERLHINQSVVSRHLKAAEKKLRKTAVKMTNQ